MTSSSRPPWFGLPGAAGRVPGACVLAACVVVACVGIFICPLPSAAETLFALVNTGEVFVSEDAGQSWLVRSTIPVRDAVGMMAGDTAEELWLVTETGSILRSADAGFEWTSAGAVSASDVVDLAGRSDGAVLAVTRTGTLWVSTDQGTSFQPLGVVTSADVRSLARGGEGQFYILTRTGTVWESLDGGMGWAPVGSLPVSDAVSLRATSTSLVALTDAGTVWKSEDQGRSWLAVAAISQVGTAGMTVVDDDLFVVNRSGVVAASADGVSWSWIGSTQQVETVALSNDLPQTTSVGQLPGDRLNAVQLRLWPNPLRRSEDLILELIDPASVSQSGTGWRFELIDPNGRVVEARHETVVPGLSSFASPLRLDSAGSSRGTDRQKSKLPLGTGRVDHGVYESTALAGARPALKPAHSPTSVSGHERVASPRSLHPFAL